MSDLVTMSDLVQRLRQWCADDLKEDHWDQHSSAQGLMEEAADEIERLRTEQRDAIDPDLYAATVAENACSARPARSPSSANGSRGKRWRMNGRNGR